MIEIASMHIAPVDIAPTEWTLNVAGCRRIVGIRGVGATAESSMDVATGNKKIMLSHITPAGPQLSSPIKKLTPITQTLVTDPTN